MTRLSRELIVQTALKLLEQVGRDGLTTRRLAQELGVKSPALYWHFKNMRELFDAIAEAMLNPAEWPGPHSPGYTPERWLAERAHAMRRELLAHRDGAALHAGTIPSAPIWALEERVSALVMHGLSPEDAVRTIMAIVRYTTGWVLEEQAYHDRDRENRTVRNLDQGSTLRQARSVLTGKDLDADFDFGLQALITGAMQRRQTRGAAGDL